MTAQPEELQKNGRSKGVGKRRLPHQIERFADEVIAGKSPTEAALVLNPEQKRSSARTKGSRFMHDPRVQAIIRERCRDAASLTAEEVIGTLATHLRVDASDFIEILSPGLAEQLREKKVGHLIQEIEIREEKANSEEATQAAEALLRKLEAHGVQLSKEAKAEVLNACAPISRTIRVRFHNSQQAAGKLSKLMGLEDEAKDRGATRKSGRV